MAILFILAIGYLLAVFLRSESEGWLRDNAIKRAGAAGERLAQRDIRQILVDGDHLLTNVEVTFDDMETEIDALIVNRNGVFIVEVKNFSGRLYGSEDDYEWEKVNVSRGGNTYTKTVANPIRQLKREIHILGNYLRFQGIKVYVEGCVMFVNACSPINSDKAVNSVDDIDSIIHSGSERQLSELMIREILEVLK